MVIENGELFTMEQLLDVPNPRHPASQTAIVAEHVD